MDRFTTSELESLALRVKEILGKTPTEARAWIRRAEDLQHAQSQAAHAAALAAPPQPPHIQQSYDPYVNMKKKDNAASPPVTRQLKQP